MCDVTSFRCLFTFPRFVFLCKIIWKITESSFPVIMECKRKLRDLDVDDSSVFSSIGEKKAKTVEDEVNKKKFICQICTKEFKRKFNLERHKKICQKNDDCKKWKCSSPDCQLVFYRSRDLNDHIKECHGLDVKNTKLIFDSYKEFLVWKRDEENKTFSSFVKQNHSDGYHRFVCNRHGARRSKSREGKRKNLKGLCHTGLQCPANMAVAIKNKIEVNYTYKHSHPLNKENLAFIRMPDDVKEEAESMLILGVAPKMVLSRINQQTSQDEFGTANENCTKRDTISIKDIQNIEQKIKRSKRLDPDDVTSVSILVNTWNERDYSPILIFKPKGSPVLIGPPFAVDKERDDCFVFGYQSKDQKNVMIRAKDGMLFVGAPHETNVENLQLFNVLAVNEDGIGYPVAFFLISHVDTSSYSLCLNSLLNKTNYVPKLVITHDDKALHASLQLAYGDKVKVYLCHWAMRQNWMKKLNPYWKTINNEVSKQNILKELDEILREMNEENFICKIEKFQTDYQNLIPDFIRYLWENYMDSPEKLRRWWSVNRRRPETNTFVESYHTTLKQNYLKRKRTKRVDYLLHVLELIEANYFRESQDLSKEEPMKTRHGRGVDIPDQDVIEISCSLWLVQSQSVSSKAYEVSLLNETCACDENLSKCTDCGILCRHILTCECEDFAEGNLCKHVHKIWDLHKIENLELPGSPYANSVKIADCVVDIEENLDAKKREKRQKMIRKYCDKILNICRNESNIEFLEWIEGELKKIIAEATFDLKYAAFNKRPNSNTRGT